MFTFAKFQEKEYFQKVDQRNWNSFSICKSFASEQNQSEKILPSLVIRFAIELWKLNSAKNISILIHFAKTEEEEEEEKKVNCAKEASKKFLTMN